jgi:hypothetical protein
MLAAGLLICVPPNSAEAFSLSPERMALMGAVLLDMGPVIKTYVPGALKTPLRPVCVQAIRSQNSNSITQVRD